MGRPAQRTRSSVPENQFRRPRPGLHGGRLTEILEPLPEPRETSTAPAREDEHRAAGSSSTRPRWTEIRQESEHRRSARFRQQSTGNSQHVDCLRGKTSSTNTKFCPRKPIPPPTSEPAQREVDGDTRAAADAVGDVHGTSPRRGTPRSREPKHQATVDNNQSRQSTTQEHW